MSIKTIFWVELIVCITSVVVSAQEDDIIKQIQESYATNSMDTETRIKTSEPFKFRYVPVTKKGCFNVRVKTREDAYISLSNAAQYIDPKTNIILGGWRNTASAIGLNDNIFNIPTKIDTSGILNGNEFRQFWVKWSQEGHIWVGKGGEETPFLLYKHKENEWYPINFVGVTSGVQVDATWIIDENPICPQFSIQ